MSKWNFKRMLWHNGATMTVKRMYEENQKMMDPETIKKINDGLEEMAESSGQELKEPSELKDWQKEIMELNED